MLYGYPTTLKLLNYKFCILHMQTYIFEKTWVCEMIKLMGKFMHLKHLIFKIKDSN